MQTYSLLFYLKKAKGNVQTSTIYIRLTVDGKRKEFSTGRTIRNKDWNAKGGKVVGNSPASKSLNLFLESLRTKIFDSYNSLFNSGKTITSKSLKNKFLGIDERNFTLLEVFGNHNDEMEELIGKGYSEGTWERYETSLRHVQEFLMWKYKISDINLSEIKPSFITNFDFFLRTVRKCANNSTVKYVKNLQKIINICLDNDWMTKDPFTNYKGKIITTEVRCLTELQLEKLKNKNFSSERLQVVKDVFLFCCYTGLAYAEVKKLESKNIISLGNEEKLIKIERTKTKLLARIPLLPTAKEILDKYKSHPKCCDTEKLLPVYSNQKINEYLKEIGDICNIDFDITFHTARHTFATTITLNNGVPIETVSKMLGHSNIRMTQHYAKIQEAKICEDMQLLKKVLEERKL